MCPIKDECLTGNCRFCDQKEGCVLMTILQKVTSLESIIEKTASQTV